MTIVSNITSIFIKAAAGFLIWIFVHSAIFGIAGKGGGMYTLDDNYKIGGWPGRVWKRYEDTQSFAIITQIEEKIEKYNISASYILFKAGNDWYGINRQSHDISKYSSLSDMKDALKINGEIHFKSSRPWLRMMFFWPAFISSTIAGLSIFLIIFREEITTRLFRRKSKTKNKINPSHSQ